MTDPIADMLTRMRNAMMKGHESVAVPFSRIKEDMVAILVREGFIEGYRTISEESHKDIRIRLKYGEEDAPVIVGLRRISKPGKRVYVGKDEIPRVLNGLGIAIISTSMGLMTDRESRKNNVGGEVLCYVW